MSSEPPIDTLDPDALENFLLELREGDFVPDDATRRTWTGPLPGALGSFTDASSMQLVLRDGWPYQPPLLCVDGIDSWHADHDRLCLWQAGDDTRAWTTLHGIHDRIEEWVDDAERDFVEHGAALDPHLYFNPPSRLVVGLDVKALVGGHDQDGQHGFLHLHAAEHLVEVLPGKPLPGSADAQLLEGRWYYRSNVASPPRNVTEFEAALTEKQRARYDSVQRRAGVAVHILIWPTPHGQAALVLQVDDTRSKRQAAAHSPTPIAVSERLRRAGPDAPVLQEKRAIIFGIGAIGSNVSSLLSRSGVGHITLVDADVVLPAGQIRHAASAETCGLLKPHAMQQTLRAFNWTTVEADNRNLWAPRELTERIAGFDVVVEATGLAPFTELVSRVAQAADVPLVSVALYRGGSIARARRQADGDTPLTARRDHWRYPSIPTSNSTSDYLGVEIGCAAPIHNASPASAMHAAVIATDMTVDMLTSRFVLLDEHIEVRSTIEEPFDHRGPFNAALPTVQITDAATATMRAAAKVAHPDETGGILVGIYDDRGAPVVVDAIEIPPADPSPARYEIESSATSDALSLARQREPRLGYIGEWHSHPTNQTASHIDKRTMRTLARHPDTGTPVLMVVRPVLDGFELDAYVALGKELEAVSLVAVGPLSGAV